MSRTTVLLALALPLALGACSFGKHSLRTEPPPLVDLEEPLDLRDEPRDEAVREKLPQGSFTGIYVGDARQSLEQMVGEPEGVLVARVVENSPADLAGVAEGDLLLEARVGGGAATSAVPMHWPSDWRKLELDTPPGTEIQLALDRAGVETRALLKTVPRARPAERAASMRFREDVRVGVVLRTATEVEARTAGLGPGAGAVVVGLSRASPWRAAGLSYGDLVTKVDGKIVAHPEVLLDAIRTCTPPKKLALEVVRAGASPPAPRIVEACVTQRAGEVHEIDIPLIYSYSSDRGLTTWSMLIGLVKHESTKAAWRWRLLWFIEFSGGDADHLEEEKS